jgi:hypothetical protein
MSRGGTGRDRHLSRHLLCGAHPIDVADIFIESVLEVKGSVSLAEADPEEDCAVRVGVLDSSSGQSEAGRGGRGFT